MIQKISLTCHNAPQAFYFCPLYIRGILNKQGWLGITKAKIYLSICLSVCLYVCLSIYLYIYLPVCLSVCMSVCLSIYLSLSCKFVSHALEDYFPQKKLILKFNYSNFPQEYIYEHDLFLFLVSKYQIMGVNSFLQITSKKDKFIKMIKWSNNW